MKIKFIRSKMAEGIKKVLPAVGDKGSLPILWCVKVSARRDDGKAVGTDRAMDGAARNGDSGGAARDGNNDGVIELVATDIDLQITAVVPGEVEEGGVTCLNAKMLKAFVEALPEGEVEIELNDAATRAKISGGACVFRLAALPPQEFPLASVPPPEPVEILARVLFEMFRKVRYAAATADDRKILKGVNMCLTGGIVRMVATDGRRLSMVECELEYPKEREASLVTIPRATVEALCGLISAKDYDGGIEVSTDEKTILFRGDGFEVLSKLVEGQYPNWTKVVPATSAYVATVDRELFLAELARAEAATIGCEPRSVSVTFENGIATLEGRGDDGNGNSKSKTQLAVKYAGEKAEFNLNASLVKDVLKVIDEEEVTIGFDGSGKPLVFKCAVPFVAVVMPLRVC